MRPGLFITFEGVEGAGKTTQIGLVAQALRSEGHNVVLTREPGGSPLAERIRALILEAGEDQPEPRTEVLLLQAARAQHVEKFIKPHLENGDIVVCDRFYDSTIAYQIHARELDEEFTRLAIEYAVDGTHPDLTVVLDLDVEEGLRRQTARNRMENEEVSFHKAVRSGFLKQAAAEPGRIRVIDASGTVEEVHERVMAVLHGVLETMEAPAGNKVES